MAVHVCSPSVSVYAIISMLNKLYCKTKAVSTVSTLCLSLFQPIVLCKSNRHITLELLCNDFYILSNVDLAMPEWSL